MTDNADIGIWVQLEKPYLDLFLPMGDRWARADDDRVFVYDDEDEVVAEAAGAHFVTACRITAESLPDIDTTDDGSEVPSS